MITIDPMAVGLATKFRSSARALSIVALAPLASIAMSARPAFADVPAAATDAQRTEIYREAVRAASAGRWAEAKERLRAVIAIRPSPKVFFSLGQAEEQLGQWASAQADYARALEGGATEGKGDVVQAAEVAQRALARRVPHLRVVVKGANATATLDDRPIALGSQVAADPGEHRLIVSAPSMKSAIVPVRLGEGQLVDVPITLEPEQNVIAAGPAAQASSLSVAPTKASNEGVAGNVQNTHESSTRGGTAWRTAGAVTASVGVIALGVGVVFGLDSKSKHDAAARACPDVTCANANDAKMWHDAVSAGNASTVAFVVGGALVVGGAVLWIAAPSSRSSNAASEPSMRVGFGPSSVHLRGAW